MSPEQKLVLIEEARRHRWISSGGPKFIVHCGCGERVENVPDRGVNLLCPQAARLLAAFGIDPKEI